MDSPKVGELDEAGYAFPYESDEREYVTIKPVAKKVQPLQSLRDQCKAAENFPRNIAHQGYPAYQIDLLYGQLREQSSRLFCNEARASIVFHEYSEHAKDFWDIWIKSLDHLEVHLALDPPRSRRDPLCRFLFVTAPTSRDQLNITYDMMTLCCTYLQIMPEFLNSLFMFGKQTRPQHFYQAAFVHRSRLSDKGFKRTQRGLEIRELGWSGFDLQLCYNFKSIERSSQGDWPWSIRDCLVAHVFDTEEVRVTWLVIKGDSLIRDRIQSATKDSNTPEMSTFKTVSTAFASTLMTHLFIAAWVRENWDQYCVFIEGRSHDFKKGIISNDFDLKPRLVKRASAGKTLTPNRIESLMNARPLTSTVARVRTWRSQNQNDGGYSEKKASNHPHIGLEAGVDPPMSPVLNETVTAEYDLHGQKDFAFRDLQQLQYILDTINEAILVLQLDIDGLKELLQFYKDILASKAFPHNVADACAEDFASFTSQVTMDIKHLVNCQIRFRMLAESVTDSMNLLYGIIDFKHAQTSKLLASYSSASSINAEKMAMEMNDIARKTKNETVSMRVITLVTLIFLPATFTSTLMSTDIFQGQDKSRASHLAQLRIFFSITIPLTLLTMAVWLFSHYREKVHTKFKKLR